MAFLTPEKQQEYRQTKRGHLTMFLHNAKRRAAQKGLQFDLDLDYLMSVATDDCPVFKVPFKWGASEMGKGNTDNNAPSLDRIVPTLGYVRGNVAFISYRANVIKQDVTEVELYAVADWLHDKRKEVLDAFPGQSTPLPTPGARPSDKNAQPGAAHGAGPRQDCDGAQHHQPELFGADAGGCT